jgi:hypothetical protein
MATSHNQVKAIVEHNTGVNLAHELPFANMFVKFNEEVQVEDAIEDYDRLGFWKTKERYDTCKYCRRIYQMANDIFKSHEMQVHTQSKLNSRFYQQAFKNARDQEQGYDAALNTIDADFSCEEHKLSLGEFYKFEDE